MSARHFPVRPNLDQLRNQAKDLLRAIRSGDPTAKAELDTNHPESVAPEQARLADAHLALARSYGIRSWPRLVRACELIDAIFEDDVDAVRALVSAHPALLHEMARGTERCNWGPPMSYAANLGRDRIVEMLHGMGAKDLEHAIGRAVLQSQIRTARLLRDLGAPLGRGEAMGPAETLSDAGLSYLMDQGVEICDEDGDPLAPVACVLETYARNPAGKHGCLALLERHGIDLPDTPPMALHRGRIDLLDSHLRRDPALLDRTFSHREIYPPELGCHADESLALHGTPLAGTTLLHLCVDFDELDTARWLLDRRADVNSPAAIDEDGFGGHTPIFGCVVSQAYRVGRRRDDSFARLLLDRGADPHVRASLRKRLRFTGDDATYEYRDVTPLSWGERFHDQAWVSRPVMSLLRGLAAKP